MQNGFIIGLILSKASINDFNIIGITPEGFMQLVFTQIRNNLHENGFELRSDQYGDTVFSKNGTDILINDVPTHISNLTDSIVNSTVNGIITPLSNFTGRAKNELLLIASACNIHFFSFEIPHLENSIFFQQKNTNIDRPRHLYYKHLLSH